MDIENNIDTQEGHMPDSADGGNPDNVTLSLTDKFLTMFDSAIGRMPYATILSNKQEDKRMKLVDLVNFVRDKATCMKPDELQLVISLLANAEFKYVWKLMECIEKENVKHELWNVNNH